MGLIKTAMMAGAGMYAVNKIAKGYENHQGARPVQQQQQQQQQQQMQPQRQSREYSPNSSQRANGGDYYDNRSSAAQPFDPTQQQRSIDPSASYPQEYWYLDNNNEWVRLPSEYANMRTSNPNYEHSAPQHPVRQQQLEFDYPQQQQQQGYVIEEANQPRSRSILGPEQIQQGLGFLMNPNSKEGKKSKDRDSGKLLNVMSMFSN
jgi:hypothetical protein